ncbi:MAG: UDP-N-acetylmuramate--L-alanine ligase [Cryomorphaceae bacterium]|nr:UDP-N-acetylmuramate--L-alanine ligase [Cryomorphaceae bacterium]
MKKFPDHIYFLGIGGIGMSALARYFLDQGNQVYGFDRSQSSLCKTLESEGAKIQYDESVTVLESIWQNAGDNALVVRTPAVRSDNHLLQHFTQKGFTIKKRSEILGEITRYKRCLAVSGTHGKTTTSSMLAHLLHFGNRKTYAFLGGIATNFGGNYVKGNEETVVVEADEYDRSFLTLSPNIALMTNTDSDHLDIYGDPDQMLKTFREFSAKSRENGILIARHGIDVPADFTYGAEVEGADYSAQNIKIINGTYCFDLYHPKGVIREVKILLPGNHNVENACGAAAIALLEGISPENIRGGLATFKGVKRRFEYHLKTEKFVYIDDYAHHPSELSALIQTVKSLYPEKKLAILFQPHLYSRTRDFADDFAAVLSKVPNLGLMPVYPARELPEDGIESTALLKIISGNNSILVSKQEVRKWIHEVRPEVLVTAGAGDIELLVPLALEEMKKISDYD